VSASNENWYWAPHNGGQRGPLTYHEVLELYRRGELGPDDHLWSAKLGEWKRAASVLDQTSTNEAVHEPPVLNSEEHLSASKKEDSWKLKQLFAAVAVMALLVGASAYALFSSSNTEGSGQIVCWGGGPSKMPSPSNKAVFRDYSVKKVTGAAACGVDQDKSLQCWGNATDAYEQALLNPPHTTEASRVFLGQLKACFSYETGGLDCWGNMDYPAPTTSAKVTNMALEDEFVCALTQSGHVICSGRNQAEINQVVTNEVPSGDVIDIAASGIFPNLCWAQASNNTLSCYSFYDKKKNVSYPFGERKIVKIISGDRLGRLVCAIVDDGGTYSMACLRDNVLISDAPSIKDGLINVGHCALFVDGNVSCSFDIGPNAAPHMFRFTSQNSRPDNVKFVSIKGGGSSICGEVAR
jgi:GYF domain 2